MTASEPLNEHINEINTAYLRGNAREHTHQRGLKALERNEKILYTATETTGAFQQSVK